MTANKRLTRLDMKYATPNSTYVPKNGRKNTTLNAPRSNQLEHLDMPVQRITILNRRTADREVIVRFDSGHESCLRWQDICKHYYLEQTTWITYEELLARI
jgi:hypothetical protein